MPSIPEYSRQNLKSSVVGTAGADYSTGQALDSIAQNTKQMAGASFDLAVKRKQAMDTALVNEHVLKAGIEEENALVQHQQDQSRFTGTPAERAAMYTKAATERSQARIKAAPNEQVRQQIVAHENDILLSNTRREIQAADTNQGVIAFTSIKTQQKLSADTAAQVGADENLTPAQKQLKINALLASAQHNITASKMVLNTEQERQFSEDVPASILKSMAAGMLVKDPGQLMTMLNEKGKDGQTIFERNKVSGEDIEKLRKDATTSMVNFDERKQREDIQANSQQISDIDKAVSANDDLGALSLTEALPDSTLKETIRKSILRRGITAEDRVEKVVELQTEYNNLIADAKAHTSKGEAKKGKQDMKATLQAILKFQTHVLEAHALGDIQDSTRTKYLTKFVSAVQQKAKGENSGLWATIVNSWEAFTGGGKTPAETTSLHGDFMDRLEKGKDDSPEGVNKAMLATLDNHMKNKFPSTLALSHTPNAVLGKNKDLVATGVKGQTGAPVSGKVPSATVTRIGTDNKTGEKFAVTFDANGKEIDRKPFNG